MLYFRFFIGDCMKKIYVYVSVLSLLLMFLAARPVYAFEGFEVTGYPFTFINGTNTYQMFSDKDMPDSAFYSIPNYEATEVGIASGFPVPYYSDGDHYSVFLNFSFAVPYQAYSNNQWVGIYIRPMLSNTYMSSASSGQWLSANVLSIAPGSGYSGGYTDVSTGSFMWQGDSQCSYRMLITCMNDAFTIANQPRIYNVSLVLDLNLTASNTLASDELRPFSISARYYLGYPTISTGYGLGLYKDFTLRCTDTSMYGLLEDIQAAVSSIDFSGLSGLADLSVTVNNIYDNLELNLALLESIYDDGETDPDVTRWGQEQSQLASDFNELQSIEHSYIDVLNDFTFPVVGDTSGAATLFNGFWNFPIIHTMIIVSLSMMVVLALLSKK